MGCKKKNSRIGPLLAGAPPRISSSALCKTKLRFLAASPFLAKPIQMSFAGFGFWLISPSARAQHCTLAGGYMRKSEEKPPVGGMSGLALGTSPRQPSRAALSPISYIAAFAWCPTVCRGTDDCGEHHPSPAPPWFARVAASGKTPKAQGNTPCAPRGGLCGCLAVCQTFFKPPGVPTGWGSLRAEPPGRASSWGV